MKNMRKEIKWCAGIFGFLVILAIFLFYCVFTGKFHYTSAKRQENRYEGQIETVISSVDKDHDGVDDQTDLLEGALQYVQTRPKYKSKYYETGYPDDDYGVCTDVVAQACLKSGYDLMELIQIDIKNDPEDYEIEEPDEKIDFRRVKNLNIYFKHTAIALTTDIHEIEQWQGGDIVVFQSHIGIVSDRRNEDGVPYIIHHSNPFQLKYEEDILETWGDIIGHYRLSE